jgi:hypothetical protein
MTKKIVVSWSGGIDSTALIANLANEGYEIYAYRLGGIYPIFFEGRELNAIQSLMKVPIIKDHVKYFTRESGQWLWYFSADRKEIPKRNHRILDRMTIWADNCKTPNLGMGEYIGADSWVVTDHVDMGECDTRSLTAYLYSEYGLKYRLFTLDNFGDARFKNNRIDIGKKIIGKDMFKTTNCLNDFEIHCGECYKCVERHVGFLKSFGYDETVYKKNPELSHYYEKYLKQM